jgi:hypothetical protein
MLAVALLIGASLSVIGQHRWPPLLDVLADLALGLNAAGYTWHWFQRVGPYDEVVHGFTIFVITFAFALLAAWRLVPQLVSHVWLYVALLASFGIAVGALWEVTEWALDSLGVRIYNTYLDTIVDIIMDTAGSLVAALISLILYNRQRPAAGISDTEP